MRSIVFGAMMAFVTRSAAAQDPLTAAKNAAKKAAAATNAHIEAEQNPEGKKASPGAKKAAGTGRVEQRAGGSLGVVASDTAGQMPTVIMREVFDYSREGRRDPFYSLLMTTELRPTLSDLMLVGILVDHVGGRSVATLRDLTSKAHYPVTVGSTLGRMRVSAIKMNSVIFTIEEFGTTRQDSLILRDSTKVRKP